MQRLLAVGLLAVALATSARAQPAAVAIGVLNDQSGPYADFGGLGSVEAAKMAVEDFGGAVLGRPVRIVAADHQNKPDIASSIATKWYDEEGVTAIADLTNSAVALAVQGIAKSRRRIALFSGPATTRLFNEDCSPTGFMWVFDTHALAQGIGSAILKEGGDTWFLVTADYAFGQQMSADLRRVIAANGGKVLGEAKHPVGTPDFSSFLLAAQASGAKVIGLLNAGTDTVNSIKQAGEFGLTARGQKVAGLVVVASDVKALGLQDAKGLALMTAYYHDRDPASRAWADRYFARTQRMPNMIQAGVYSSVLHYLRAVDAAATTDGEAVAAKMRSMPVRDFFADGATIRADGRLMNPMYLAEVKTPAESTGAWDLLRVVRAIPASELIIPAGESKCPLMRP